MRRSLALVVLLLVTAATALGIDELLQKYKHRYTDVEEGDVDKIGQFLASSSPEERWEAATQIAAALRKGFPSAKKFIPVLIELLRTDSDNHVRVSAAVALYRSADPRAIEPLLEVAGDTGLTPDLRGAALDGLFKMNARTAEIEEIAVEELDSPHHHLRCRAIQILGRSTDSKRLEKLVEAYVEHHENPDESLKKAKVYTTFADNAYDNLSCTYSLCIGAIVEGAPELLPRLIKHPNSRIRLDIASALAMRGDTRAVPILVALSRSDRPEIRRPAVEILSYASFHYQRKDERVIEALKAALEDKFTVPGRNGKPYRVIADMAYKGLLRMGIEIDEPEDLEESRLFGVP